MDFKKHRFNPQKDADFAQVLRKRVNDYFQKNDISVNANAQMVAKTIILLTVALGPLILMVTGVVSGFWAYLVSWILMGLGIAGVGLSVMHDSVHGSYSKNKNINGLIGLTMNIIGGSAFVWKIQHNVLHHSFTNVAHGDDDIETPPILRISPHRERMKIHRYQHIYAWVLYALSSLFWITAKDFRRIYMYRDMGLTGPEEKFTQEFAKMTLWKVFYYGYALALPIIFLPIPWYSTLGYFVVMHIVIGSVLSSVFQAAHILPELDFVENPEDQINQNWFVHQLRTTSNFAQGNKFVTWYIGGLNHQVEHHLFPNICHVHYPKIAPIVQKTAFEFDIPYHNAGSFLKAMASHQRMLKTLGRTDELTTVTMPMVKESQTEPKEKAEPVLV